MTRKHFVIIAQSLLLEHAPRNVCQGLANEFQEMNPNFDMDKFMKACGHG